MTAAADSSQLSYVRSKAPGDTARYLAGIAGRAGLTILERTGGGPPGLVAQVDAFDVAGGRIKHIRAILNPGKLGPWTTG